MLNSEQLTMVISRGQGSEAVKLAMELLSEGITVEQIIASVTTAMRSLDVKCTSDQFNLLEILLAGRAMLQVLDTVEKKLGNKVNTSVSGRIILGTIEGDVHDLGKNVTQMLFRAAGFEVIDLGTDVPPEEFVAAAADKKADFIGVSSLISTTVTCIRQLRLLADTAGLKEIKIIAGGGAIKQLKADDLNVDLVAVDVFAGLRFCQGEEKTP